MDAGYQAVKMFYGNIERAEGGWKRSNRCYGRLFDNYLILKLFYEITSTATGEKIFFIHNNIYLDKRGEVT
jgi:nitric oxide synthase oxygenase domain/subunit